MNVSQFLGKVAALSISSRVRARIEETAIPVEAYF